MSLLLSTKECVTLLNEITVANQKIPPEELRNDIFDALTSSFKKFISSDNRLLSVFDSFLGVESACEPSTSKHEDIRVQDARILYGALLSVIYEQLGDSLTRKRSENASADEYTFLSLKDIALISSSVQMFILTQCLPFIEEGVGIPVKQRSTFIKTWTRLVDDKRFQWKQLCKGLTIFRQLVECNAALRAEIIGRYLADIICVYEQLREVGECPSELRTFVDSLFSTVPPSLLISTCLMLLKCVDPKCATPKWFAMAVGNRLSNNLMKEKGLSHFLEVYMEMGGEQFWQNSHLLSRIAKQFSTPPASIKKMRYFEKMCSQFEELIFSDLEKFPAKSVANLYSIFVDEMNSREPLAGDVFVLDRLFKPWESVLQSSITSKWTVEHQRSLLPLDLWSDEKMCPKIVSTSSRLLEIVPLFLLLLPSEDTSTDVSILQTIRSQLCAVLKLALNGASLDLKRGQFLLDFISNSDFPMFRLFCKRKLVAVVGEDDQDDDIKIESVDCSDQEEGLMIRLNAVQIFFAKLESSTQNRFLLELLCDSVKCWTKKTAAAEDLPRFVEVQPAGTSSDWSRLSSHLVAVFCFEQLGEADIDGSDSTVVISLVDLVKSILESGRESDWSHSSFLDVRRLENEEEKRMRELRISTLRMAVAMIGAVVGAAMNSEQLLDHLSSLAPQLTLFIAFCNQSKDDDLIGLAKEAERVLDLLSMIGITVDLDRTSISAQPKRGLPVDFVGDLKRNLTDPLEPIRGEALLQVSRSIRRKDQRLLTVLDDWLYPMVKELLTDPDSYVFLSAINAIAEIACCNPKKYLTDLLTLFRELALQNNDQKEVLDVNQTGSSGESNPTQDDSTVILKGKLAEAIGKVFRQLGDISPFWLEQAASTFLSSLRDPNDIVRASSLSAFSDLILSCRGCGLEKYLDELLYAVNQLIRSDVSALVRRAGVHLIRQILRSCDARLIEIIGGRLRDLRRTLQWLWKWDRDHVVRLHAELSLEQLNECMKSALECTAESSMRVIRIK